MTDRQDNTEANDTEATPVDAPIDPREAMRVKLAEKMPAHVRPEALATALGISGKIVRAHLRSTYPRPIEAKGTTWVMTQEQAIDTFVHFKFRTTGGEAAQTLNLDD